MVPRMASDGWGSTAVDVSGTLPTGEEVDGAPASSGDVIGVLVVSRSEVSGAASAAGSAALRLLTGSDVEVEVGADEDEALAVDEL